MDEEKQGMRELEENPIPGGPSDPSAGRPHAERNSD
jgi:hypothetical protein